MTKVGSHHAEWLGLLEVSGPFLSLPVLERVFPQGLDAHDSDQASKLRLAREEWMEEQRREGPDPEIHDLWVEFVLSETLEYTPAVLHKGSSLGTEFEGRVEEHDEVLRPQFVLASPDAEPAPSSTRLLIDVELAAQDPQESIPSASWAASPIARMTHLCRALGVRLGLVTNGERWVLIDAPRGETAAHVSWYASLWTLEPLTLRAFRSLLGVRRFFGVAESETLEGMLSESVTYQAEVTEQLGAQVRRAVEVLVQALDRADTDSGRKLLNEVSETQLYEAALTIMMRLVFLFYAEENDLLPLGDRFYQENYAASSLQGQLRAEADRVGVEVLERRQDAWTRLLSTFRAIHGGIEHEALRLPPYGGSLFDPDRFCFLEGRPPSSTWRKVAAEPLPVDNRTVLHLLDALQTLQMHGRAGVESRKLSFRGLDIEQIGHVYEMLLDHQVVRADSALVGLVGARGQEPEVAVQELDDLRARGADDLLGFLKRKTGKSRSALSKLLEKEPEPGWVQALRTVCRGDEELLNRILAYHGIIRPDPWGEPIVIQPGSVFVTGGTERRSTGTYYTPRALTEEVVTHALEPLVFRGPSEGTPREEWSLKRASEILELKVCDLAMGSGAFLVQVIRWLSERLLEAWEEAEEESGQITTEGVSLIDQPTGAVVPVEPEERAALARRVVADRCIYGVDVNPLAVEMAKLSLWLVTLAKGRPFSFLDHALKCGDSLLGIHELDQIRHFHIEPDQGKELHATLFDPTRHLESVVQEALELRRQLESFTVRDVRDAEQKANLNRRADSALNRLRLVADLVVGAAISAAGQGTEVLDKKLQSLGDRLGSMFDVPGTDVDTLLRADAATMLNEGKPPFRPDRRPFHWPIEFPEVFWREGRGFDAIVGNPPFLGGVDLASTLGVPYERHLKASVPESVGFVDLAAYFHRRTLSLVSKAGTACLLGPQNLIATANRKAALEPILKSGYRILHGRRRVLWPGTASVEVCIICYGPDAWECEAELDGVVVPSIGPSLDSEIDVSAARRLPPWLTYSEGTHLYGTAFLKTQEEWKPFLKAEPELASYLRPYVNAQILCSTPNCRTDLLVVDFGERDKESLGDVREAVAYLEREVGRERAKQTRQIHEHRPWLFWDKRSATYAAARELKRVLVCPNLSKHLPMMFVDPAYLFSKAVKFFVTEDEAVFGLLQSTVFAVWVLATSPMREGRIAFSTRNSFDTFPTPSLSPQTRSVGRAYWDARVSALHSRNVGITDLLNAFHDSDDSSDDVSHLRQLHAQLDSAVLHDFGWSDIELTLGFHETQQGIRYTADLVVRTELLRRLLALNQERHSVPSEQLSLGAR